MHSFDRPLPGFCQTFAQIFAVCLLCASTQVLAQAPPALLAANKLNPTEPAALGVSAALKPAPLTLASLAQNDRQYTIGAEVSVGVFHPNGQLKNLNSLNTTVAMGASLALRPRQLPRKLSRLQIDAGADFIIDGIGALRKEQALPNDFRGIDDVETFLYLGPRVYLTPRTHTLRISLGGGGAFVYYKDRTSTYDVDKDGDENDTPCFSCESRKGWGVYALTQVRYQIVPEFGIGVTAKYHRARTSGAAGANRTIDNWLGLMLTLSIR